MSATGRVPSPMPRSLEYPLVGVEEALRAGEALLRLGQSLTDAATYASRQQFMALPADDLAMAQRQILDLLGVLENAALLDVALYCRRLADLPDELPECCGPCSHCAGGEAAEPCYEDALEGFRLRTEGIRDEDVEDGDAVAG